MQRALTHSPSLPNLQDAWQRHQWRPAGHCVEQRGAGSSRVRVAQRSPWDSRDAQQRLSPTWVERDADGQQRHRQRAKRAGEAAADCGETDAWRRWCVKVAVFCSFSRTRALCSNPDALFRHLAIRSWVGRHAAGDVGAAADRADLLW